MTTWHEKDDFWEKLAPFMFPEEQWEGMQEEVDQILALLNLGEVSEVLDLCCGPGRHSLEFARRGYHVTGVDRTSTYLQQARQSAEREGLKVEFIQEDMRKFMRPLSFNVALLMFTSFGYFEEHDQNLQVLENVWNSLRDGGKILIDVMGKEVLARIFQPQGWEERDGVFWLQERKISPDWRKIENRWIVTGNEEHYEISFSHWIYSAVELSKMLEEVGFASVDCFGDLMGSEYGNEARRLVCVGQK
jgi:SAM-dependent methyltransferase